MARRVTDDLECLIDRPPCTFAQFARDSAEVFPPKADSGEIDGGKTLSEVAYLHMLKWEKR